MTNQSRRAIVMGASVAGMWAARVLADHFDDVLILERDSLPEGPELRPGVPQSRQYHIMLLKGLQLMDDLFPGLRDELIEAGAIPFDTVNDVALRSRGTWLPRFPSGQYLLSCSRTLLEAGIRRHLRRRDAIRFVENVNVTGLETDAQAQRITGVHVTHKDDADRAETFTADLIVDTLGRRSPTPEWLTALGYAAPEESSVNSFLGYVTRRYRIPDNFQADWRMLMILATPPDQPRGGLIFPEENNVWCVMMAGANKDYPPTDDDGFVDFARSLGTEFHRAVQAAEPLTQAYGYRGTESRRRHYEKLTRWPDRYVVLGDALCGFNPVYGQGMTVAAMSAVAMGDAIRDAGGNLDGLAQPLLRQISTITDGAWLLATSADKDWPETIGGAQKEGIADRFGSWYIGRMLDATAKDPVVRLAFLEVNQLVKPATSLFAPGVMLRIFRQMLRPRVSVIDPNLTTSHEETTMTKLAIGSSVRFKPGVKDNDFDVDIGGWQGRIVEFEQEHDTVTVAFDSITLRSMPGEYIETCEEEGLDWTEYGAGLDDLEAVPPRDTTADVEDAIAELSARYAYSHLGEEGREMNAILAGIEPDDTMAVMERWGDYLGQTLKFPFDAEVVELLFERGPIRHGDRLRVLGIHMIDDSYGVLADVKRGRQSFVHPLCDLETTNTKSPNHDPLQLYRVWFANR